MEAADTASPALQTAASRAVTDLRLLYAGARGSEWQARARVHAATTNLTELSVTGLKIGINSISAEDVENTLLPLVLWLAQQCTGRRRVVVGVTGAGGAGKSVACEVLAACLRALPSDCFGDPDSEGDPSRHEAAMGGHEEPAPIGHYGVAVLGVDAFHFPNTYLLENEATLHSGQRAPLKAVKGTPQTMDIAGLIRTLHLILDGAEIQLPYYDRHDHNPCPAGPLVTPETRLVLVEGIHLLHTEDQWTKIRELLTCCIHLDTSSMECRRRLIQRKSAPGGGRSVAQATAHYELVDRQNLRAHQLSRGLADLVLRFRPGTFDVLCATKGPAVTNGLALPTASPAIIVVADSPTRPAAMTEAACSWQRGCAVSIAQFYVQYLRQLRIEHCIISGLYQIDSAHGTSTIDEVAVSVSDGYCAALVFCGALDRCGGSAEDWAKLAKQLPADLLLFSNLVATELIGTAGQDHRGIPQRLLGCVDVLWTDVGALRALFEDGWNGVHIADGDTSADEETIVVDLLQSMVRTALRLERLIVACDSIQLQVDRRCASVAGCARAICARCLQHASNIYTGPQTRLETQSISRFWLRDTGLLAVP